MYARGCRGRRKRSEGEYAVWGDERGRRGRGRELQWSRIGRRERGWRVRDGSCVLGECIGARGVGREGGIGGRCE